MIGKKKKSIDKAGKIKKKDGFINQLNHKAPEKSHVTDELVGYNL